MLSVKCYNTHDKILRWEQEVYIAGKGEEMITKTQIGKLIEKGQEGPTLDFKQDLLLATDVDKANFVKDILALANSSGTAHLIIGIEDETWKPIGIKTSHTTEQLNQILKDKCDPPLSVEYVEKEILHHTIGVIEIKGNNPPYVVAVPDRYGGIVERGTVFVRNFNMNQGASRDDLDRIYSIKYAAPQAELQLQHKIEKKPSGNLTEVDIKFTLHNSGKAPAINPYLLLRFKEIEELVGCKGGCQNISDLNDNVPMIHWQGMLPIYCDVSQPIGSVIIKVKKITTLLEASLDIQAGNMQRIKGSHTFPIISELMHESPNS